VGDGQAVKLSVNVSAEIGGRLRRLAFDERLSESSIVEIALSQLFGKILNDSALGRFLRDHGATLRRAGGRR
jgi:predicted transcriptional regulator